MQQLIFRSRNQNSPEAITPDVVKSRQPIILHTVVLGRLYKFEMDSWPINCWSSGIIWPRRAINSAFAKTVQNRMRLLARRRISSYAPF